MKEIYLFEVISRSMPTWRSSRKLMEQASWPSLDSPGSVEISTFPPMVRAGIGQVSPMGRLLAHS